MMSKQQQVLAALVIGLVILLLAQLALGATVPESAPLGTFVRVKLEDGEKAIVLSQDFMKVDIIATPGVLAFTGLPGRYVVVVLKGDEQPQQYFTSITGTVPTPPTPVPPDPTPPLPSGLAGEVYKLAQPIQQPEKCLKYAANYEVVSTEIAAGALRTLPEVRSRIVSLNQPLQAEPRDIRWQSVGTAIQAAMAKATTVEDAKRVIDEAATGLRLAGVK